LILSVYLIVSLISQGVLFSWLYDTLAKPALLLQLAGSHGFNGVLNGASFSTPTYLLLKKKRHIATAMLTFFDLYNSNLHYFILYLTMVNCTYLVLKLGYKQQSL